MSNIKKAMDSMNVIEFSSIKNVDDLRIVLEGKHKSIIDNIHRLSMSSTPEDNYTRLQLLGKRELIVNLLARIK